MKRFAYTHIPVQRRTFREKHQRRHDQRQQHCHRDNERGDWLAAAAAARPAGVGRFAAQFRLAESVDQREVRRAGQRLVVVVRRTHSAAPAGRWRPIAMPAAGQVVKRFDVEANGVGVRIVSARNGGVRNRVRGRYVVGTAVGAGRADVVVINVVVFDAVRLAATMLEGDELNRMEWSYAWLAALPHYRCLVDGAAVETGQIAVRVGGVNHMRVHFRAGYVRLGGCLLDSGHMRTAMNRK